MGRGGSVRIAGLGVARIAVGVLLPVSAQGLIEHLVAERTFNSEGMDEGAVVADRMVGPGGTGDSSLRVAFCLLRSKFCISCKTSRNFGKVLERSFAYSDSFMSINSS